MVLLYIQYNSDGQQQYQCKSCDKTSCSPINFLEIQRFETKQIGYEHCQQMHQHEQKLNPAAPSSLAGDIIESLFHEGCLSHSPIACHKERTGLRLAQDPVPKTVQDILTTDECAIHAVFVALLAMLPERKVVIQASGA